MSGGTRFWVHWYYGGVEGSLSTAADGLCAHSVDPLWSEDDAAYVAEAHALGLRVYPWTVNEPGDIRTGHRIRRGRCIFRLPR